MSRPSKLTAEHCARAMYLHRKNAKRWSAAKLAKKYNVSDSSMYKVLNGTYNMRQICKQQPIETVTPQIVPPTPRLFTRRSTDVLHTSAPNINLDTLGEADDVTLAAAQLIVSRSRFAQALREAKH